MESTEKTKALQNMSRKYHDYLHSASTASPIQVREMMDKWAEKMWDNDQSEQLLSTYLRVWMWVMYLERITRLQADNVLRYITYHDEEQIINHVMDLERSW